MIGKTLTKEEWEEWVDQINPPFQLMITQVSQDTLILQRIYFDDKK